MSGGAPGPTSGQGSSRSRVNLGNGLSGPRVAARTVKAVRRTVAAEEGMETTASVLPLARGRGGHAHLSHSCVVQTRAPTRTPPVTEPGPSIMLGLVEDDDRLAL